MKNCKGCGSEKLVKNGKNKAGVQRYKCKDCMSTYIKGDTRRKYGLEKRLKVISMYLEGVGIRSIERLEGVSTPLIIYWIRHYAQLIRQALKNASIPDRIQDIQIVELDEWFTYYKKRPNVRTYGLLLTETKMQLLICRSLKAGNETIHLTV